MQFDTCNDVGIIFNILSDSVPPPREDCYNKSVRLLHTWNWYPLECAFYGRFETTIQDVGVGMFKYSSLMGTFTIPTPTYIPQTTPVFSITSEVYIMLKIF